MFGPVAKKVNESLGDLSPREMAVAIPLAAMMFFMGVFPQPFLSRTEPAAAKVVKVAAGEPETVGTAEERFRSGTR